MMLCVCGHQEENHGEGECHSGISELTDGSFVWQCSCPGFRAVKGASNDT